MCLDPRLVRVGNGVLYIDAEGMQHAAVVTAVWPGYGDPPGINLVYVTGDESKDDPYGRQIARDTSVAPEARKSAPGRYWTTLTS